MAPADRSTGSTWQNTTRPPDLPRLQEDLDVDVAVVGGGIAGLTSAYLLAGTGRTVAVLEQETVGSGMTGHTTAHLTVVQDRHFVAYEKKHGRAAAITIGQSHMAAIRFIADLVASRSIDCDHAELDGFLVDTHGSLKGDDLMRELHLLQEIGIDDATVLPEGAVGILADGRGLRVPHQGRIHALKYLYGLLEACTERGVQVYQHTHVSGVEAGAVKVAGDLTVNAATVVIATHTPIGAKRLAMQLTPLTTYVVAAPMPRGAVQDALYWDTEEPYHYIRFQPWDDGQDLVLVGGADHRTGETTGEPPNEAYRTIEAWARAHLPQMGPVAQRWSGQVFDPTDGVALIGRSPEHPGQTYVATGFSGNGTTHGTLAGILLTALVQGEAHPWAQVYDPSRLKSLMTRESLSHNMSAAKHMIRDRFRNQGGESPDALAAGTGAVVGKGGEALAVYRHEDGRLERHSATCTHMGCTVQWNEFEKTFDCPCHGSRFGVDGSVLSGPTLAPLKPAPEQTERAKTAR